VRVLAEAIADAAEASMPLVIFRAPYDLTVTDRECKRHGIPPFVVGPVIDPFVIDKHLDRYRRGLRQLEAMCAHHNAIIAGAHDATHDALAAARLAYRLGSSGKVIRRVRNADEGREKAALVRQWEAVRGDLPALHDAQRWWAAEQARGLAEHFREHPEKGVDPDDVRTDWPILAAA
jgi:DNA polymerase III subunit epsilon